jgi:hypothetical protein
MRKHFVREITDGGFHYSRHRPSRVSGSSRTKTYGKGLAMYLTCVISGVSALY